MGELGAGELAYERLQAEVIRPGLCTHCGTCAALSEGTVAMRQTPRGPQPTAVAASPRVAPAALESCPGRAIDYPGLHRFVFGSPVDDWLAGRHRQAWIGYSAVPQVRRQAASGGVITQTLLHLLETGEVDGAIVVRQGRPRPWEAEAFIATTPEEILDASQSVYQPVPVNLALEAAASFDGRLAYVGLPDQVASLRKLQQLGHEGARRVEYVLGPYTGTNMYFAAIESYLRSNGVEGGVESIAELRWREGEWPGHLQIRTTDGRVLRAEKFYYNYLIPFYITRATLFAVDFTNELTDISVGDAWHPRYETQGGGFSVVLARTEKGAAVLEAMRAKGIVELDPIPLDEALAMHGHMLDFKKRGSFLRMRWWRRLGRPMPSYGYEAVDIPLARRLVELVILSIFSLAATRPARYVVERLPLGLVGPLFNTLRKTWKSASRPTKRKGLRETRFRAVADGGQSVPVGNQEGARVGS